MGKQTMPYVLMSFFWLSILTFPSMAKKWNVDTTLQYPPTATNFTPIRSIMQIPQTEDPSSFNYEIPLVAIPPGIFLIPIGLGTPTQTLHWIFSTGSSFVWSPCGPNFKCFPSILSINQRRFPTIYDAQTSSTWGHVMCNNPKCWWVIAKRPQSDGESCNRYSSQNCSKDCPAYEYALSNVLTTTGRLLLDTLHISNHTMNDFLFGCSKSSTLSPIGFAGFGRGLDSLPSQMGVKKFSYCLSSGIVHHPKYEISKGALNGGLSYIQFHKCPSNFSPLLRNYYYVILQDIIVGNVALHIPKKFQIPKSNGFGGTIVDTTRGLTIIHRDIFNLMGREFRKQMEKDATNIVSTGFLEHCFKVKDNYNAFPKLVYRFKGNASMELPFYNYFVEVEENTFCLAFIASDNDSSEPAIILGATLQQDFYFEFDLEKGRLGFRRHNCGGEMVLKLKI